MKPTALSTLAAWAGGELLSGDPNALVQGVEIDSRAVGPGKLFVAIRGTRVDGHDFIAQVDEAQAAAVLIRKDQAATLPPLRHAAVIAVDDTVAGLKALATAYRASLNVRIIAVTGSNGKTSTKDLIRTVLAKQAGVYSTLGNLNNHLGVPLTLLSIDDTHDFAIVEMGMNHFGEILPLTQFAKPEIGVITNIGVAHIEHLGSRAGIALEKGVLLEELPAHGLAVVPAEDDFREALASRTQAKVLSAGIEKGDVQARNVRQLPYGSAFTLRFSSGAEVEVELPILGRHMVSNAALAAAVAESVGISPENVAQALNSIVLTQGRLEIKRVGDVLFIDDSYNANPDSMKAALRTLAEMEGAGRKIAVLGRMGELGEHAESCHREIGEVAAKHAIDAVFSVGHDQAAWITESAQQHGDSRIITQHFASHEAAAAYLQTFLAKDDIVLLKGSRSSTMEKVLNAYTTP